MASSSGGNYYASLDPSPKRKKNNNTTNHFNINNTIDFPTIKHNKQNTNNKNQCPKFIVLKSKVPDKPIQNFNIFLVSKALEGISSETTQKITFTRDGNLLILTKNEAQATRFLKATNLTGVCPIESYLHPTLNIIKGVVFAPTLRDLSVEEITDGLKEQGVVDCRKITKFTDNHVVNTPLHILHFNLYQLPKEIKIGFLNCKIEPYIPNPIQCKNCFKLGHTRKHCKSTEMCDICATIVHDPTPCTKIQCINCNNAHRSNNKNCPVIKERQEILKIKTENNCSYKEAALQINETQTHDIPIEDLQTAIEERKKKKVTHIPSTDHQKNTPIQTTTQNSKQNETINTQQTSLSHKAEYIKKNIETSLNRLITQQNQRKSQTPNESTNESINNVNTNNTNPMNVPMEVMSSTSPDTSPIKSDGKTKESDQKFKPAKIQNRRNAIDSPTLSTER